MVIDAKAEASAHVKQKTVPPKVPKRYTRGPVYFKCVLVDYDKAEGKVKLRPGTFVGQSDDKWGKAKLGKAKLPQRKLSEQTFYGATLEDVGDEDDTEDLTGATYT